MIDNKNCMIVIVPRDNMITQDILENLNTLSNHRDGLQLRKRDAFKSLFIRVMFLFVVILQNTSSSG